MNVLGWKGHGESGQSYMLGDNMNWQCFFGVCFGYIYSEILMCISFDPKNLFPECTTYSRFHKINMHEDNH